MKHCALFPACLCLLVSVARGAEPSADAGELYSKITDAYMTGKFTQLNAHLAQATRRMREFTPEQKADILYVRKAIAECRPKWWFACMAGRKTLIRQTIFGKPVRTIYDPAGKDGMQMKTDPGGKITSMSVSWDPRSMESTEPGKYGFPKGDLTCGGIWSNLAMARLWSSLPRKTISKMSDRDKLRLNRYMSFRANLAALYYTTPSSRRYFLHIFFAAFYYDNWGKSETSGARRAACAMVMCEILKDPKRYPSIKLPKQLNAEKAEEKLGQHFKMAFNRNTPWTIAEDRTMREAIRSFARVADKTVFKTERVILPNKLVFAIDAKLDETIRPKRDAWIKKQFDSAKAGAE